jgi:hypothetical protein
VITLTGTAPVEVKGITVNGSAYPVTWTSAANWAIALELPSGQTAFTVGAYDAGGNVLANYTDSIKISFNEIRIVETSVALNGDLLITWSAEAGRTYGVQFKDDLNASVWTDLAEVIATGPFASSTNNINAPPQRFYRIRLMEP